MEGEVPLPAPPRGEGLLHVVRGGGERPSPKFNSNCIINFSIYLDQYV